MKGDDSQLPSIKYIDLNDEENYWVLCTDIIPRIGERVILNDEPYRVLDITTWPQLTGKVRILIEKE